MNNRQSVSTGAERIISDCLDLKKGQHLVVFMDETTCDVAGEIAVAAAGLGVPLTSFFIPVAVQKQIPDERDLNVMVQRAAKEARGILNCVNAQADCLRFRERILESHWSARTRIGHMPGATLEVLVLANADARQLVEDCRLVEIAMARAQTVRIDTFTSAGEGHTLTARLGGWERLPVASDGIIHDGVWGNVPSGETYIAPLEGSAEGSIVINGSVPGRVVNGDEEIVLYFEEGRLTDSKPEESPTFAWLEETQLKGAKAKGDANWSNLAEIGIGLNPAVTSLTGNILLDEKAAGTIHVALGSNTFMGGRIDATIHCDLVIKGATVVVDDCTIVERGRLQRDEHQCRGTYTAVNLEGSPFAAVDGVSRSGIEVIASDHQLERRLRPEPGRVSSCPVGDDPTSRLAQQIYGLIPEDGSTIAIHDLSEAAGVDLETVRRVLHVMWEYELVTLD